MIQLPYGLRRRKPRLGHPTSTLRQVRQQQERLSPCLSTLSCVQPGALLLTRLLALCTAATSASTLFLGVASTICPRACWQLDSCCLSRLTRQRPLSCQRNAPTKKRFAVCALGGSPNRSTLALRAASVLAMWVWTASRLFRPMGFRTLRVRAVAFHCRYKTRCVPQWHTLRCCNSTYNAMYCRSILVCSGHGGCAGFA